MLHNQNINIKKLAHHIQAAQQCKEGYKEPHQEAIEQICSLLPHGSGIDSGMKLIIEDCKKDKLVFQCDFHHMDDNGFYDGWTEHKVIITPSLIDGFNIRITGRNKREIKDYLSDMFYEMFIYE